MAESNAPLIGKEDGDECADRKLRETADDYPSIARSGRWRKRDLAVLLENLP